MNVTIRIPVLAVHVQTLLVISHVLVVKVIISREILAQVRMDVHRYKTIQTTQYYCTEYIMQPRYQLVQRFNPCGAQVIDDSSRTHTILSPSFQVCPTKSLLLLVLQVIFGVSAPAVSRRRPLLLFPCAFQVPDVQVAGMQDGLYIWTDDRIVQLVTMPIILSGHETPKDVMQIECKSSKKQIHDHLHLPKLKHIYEINHFLTHTNERAKFITSLQLSKIRTLLKMSFIQAVATYCFFVSEILFWHTVSINQN